MRKLLALFLNISFCIQAQSAEFSLPLPKFCKKEVVKQIVKLTHIQHWRRQSYAGVGTAAIYRTPTEVVGKWIETKIYNNKYVQVLEITPEKRVHYSWDITNCNVLKTESVKKYNQERLANEFSDQRLLDTIEKKKAGVIYAWSPHMPLSMAGIKPLKDATEKLGLELILILDPHADKKISLETAEKFLLEESALRKLESVDLMLRGLGFHYPALVVFGNGKMNDYAIPGVKTSGEYQKLISRQLASLKEAK